MAKHRQLQQLYRFPGFLPEADIRGLFGDHMAVVIRLRRRQKKRPAGSVVCSVAAPTTNDFVEYATSPAAIDASTLPSGGGGSIAPDAKP